jgi:hypothetical protein
VDHDILLDHAFSGEDNVLGSKDGSLSADFVPSFLQSLSAWIDPLNKKVGQSQYIPLGPQALVASFQPTAPARLLAML